MMNPTHSLFLLAGLTTGNYFLQGQLLQVDVVLILDDQVFGVFFLLVLHYMMTVLQIINFSSTQLPSDFTSYDANSFSSFTTHVKNNSTTFT
jgi:hypothetical protein